MKKIFFLILLTLFSVCVFSCSEHKNDSNDKIFTDVVYGFTYEIDENTNTCTIIDKGDFNGKSLVIPGKIAGRPVTRIAANAFQGCNTLQTVKIPDSIMEIGYGAFDSCKNLTDINIPNKAFKIGRAAFYNTGFYNNEKNWEDYFYLYIGPHLISVKTDIRVGSIKDGTINLADGAFSDCVLLDAIELPTGLISIGNNAFEFCCFLQEMIIPDTVTTIGSYAFYNCNDLKTVFIPEGTDNIGVGVFLGCEDLNEITIDENNSHFVFEHEMLLSKDKTKLLLCLNRHSVTYTVLDGIVEICPKAFSGDLLIKSVVVPPSVKIVGDGAFSNCKNMEAIRFEGALDEIGSEAFSGCENLLNCDISAGLECLKDEAFSGCGKMQFFNIPSDTKLIGKKVFYRCQSLQRISVSEENEYYLSQNGILFDAEMKRLIKYPALIELEGYEMPESVECIEDFSFESCKFLKYVILPERLESLSDNAFTDCCSLEEIAFGNDLIGIGKFCFMNCIGLKELVIPESVHTIGEGAFNNCQGLVSVELSPNLEVVESSVFYECSSLRSIFIGGDITQIREFAFAHCTGLRSIEIAEKVRMIDETAFAACSYVECFDVSPENKNYCDFQGALYTIDMKTLVKAVNIPEQYVFTVPQGVETISAYAFNELANVRRVFLSESVKTIRYKAFQNCYNLFEVDLNQCEEIEYDAFRGASSLSKVRFSDRLKTIGSYAFCFSGVKGTLIFPNSIETIESYAFLGCDDLTEVHLPEKIEEVSNYLFSDCSNLYTVIIPDGVRKIGDGTFRECRNLSNVIMANSVVEIGNGAFEGCDMKNAVFSSNIIEVGNNAFYGCAGLRKFEFAEGTKIINEFAFCGCGNLEEIVIPKSVEEIGNSAIMYTNIRDVYYKGDPKRWTEIEINYYNDNLEPLLSFYSEDEPGRQWEKSYWRYVSGIPTKW